MIETFAIESLSVSLAVAFVFGMLAKMGGFPPMIGFLAAGFALGQLGFEATEGSRAIAELGVTLLLFTVGLKLNLRTLAQAEVWGTASLHMGLTVILATGALLAVSAAGIGMFAGLTLKSALVIAFALSFSSTVFAVKAYEEKGEGASLHARTVVGILIFQDLAAVVFIAASTGELPSLWAVALIGLIFVRPLLGILLDNLGHTELLPLFGLCSMLVLGVAAFSLVGLKADLGALVMGVLLGQHKRAAEVADSLVSFKGIFLIGFFLHIGLVGLPTTEAFLTALALTALIPLKAACFFLLLSRFRLRARSALLGGVALATYSEFALIVGAVALKTGLITEDWVLVLALAMALSFVLIAPLNARDNSIYARFQHVLGRFERDETLPDDQPPETGAARVAVFGMGRIGTAAFDSLRPRLGRALIGIETDLEKVERHQEAGRNVVHGDACDPDFWERLRARGEELSAVLLAMPEHHANMYALEQIRAGDYKGFVAVMTRFPDEIDSFLEAGADVAYDLFAEAGTGFADQVGRRIVRVPG